MTDYVETPKTNTTDKVYIDKGVYWKYLSGLVKHNELPDPDYRGTLPCGTDIYVHTVDMVGKISDNSK